MLAADVGKIGEGGEPDAAVSTFASVSGTAIDTLPGCSPPSRNADVAVPTDCPIRLGITNILGGELSLTRRLILGAEMSLAFAGGLWESTRSAGIPGMAIWATEAISS